MGVVSPTVFRKNRVAGALVGAAVVALLAFASGLLADKGTLVAAIEALALGAVVFVGAFFSNAFLQNQTAKRQPR